MNEEKISAVLEAAEEVEAAIQNLRLDPALKAATDKLYAATKAARAAQKLPCPRRLIWVEVSGGIAEVSLSGGRLPAGWGYELLDYDNLQEEITTVAQFHELPVFMAHRILQTNPWFLEKIQRAEQQAAEEAVKARAQRREQLVRLAEDMTPEDLTELTDELLPMAEQITRNAKRQPGA